ncbi:MAG: hypothetical protein JW716_05555 [Candidatus Aenigmarchaeota archaeon]|nr:hypothetical protein [Candidatus Aenigmarchaeota archaeon]
MTGTRGEDVWRYLHKISPKDGNFPTLAKRASRFIQRFTYEHVLNGDLNINTGPMYASLVQKIGLYGSLRHADRKN